MVCSSQALYPAIGVQALRTQRGQRWAELIGWVAELPATAPEAMAFTLTIRRLRRYLFPTEDGQLHNLRCAHCVNRLVRAFEGTEKDLLTVYYENLQEIYGALDYIQESAHEGVKTA